MEHDDGGRFREGEKVRAVGAPIEAESLVGSESAEREARWDLVFNDQDAGSIHSGSQLVIGDREQRG